MRLLLVRHGETDWNVQKKIQGSTDTKLNSNGILQAKQLGETLKENNRNISKIYTSKQKRAKKTAEIISNYLGVEYTEWDGLEEMNLGLWEGNSWTEVEDKFPLEYQEWIDNRRYSRTPQGESYQDLLERLIPSLKRIITIEKDDVLVVTHSADIMVLLSYINEIPFSEMAEYYKMENTAMIEIDSKEIDRLMI
ncbi:MAG: histidine phosphatase family protein [Mobilitalea sp.]